MDPASISRSSASAVDALACHLSRHGLIDFGQEIEVTEGVEIGRASAIYARVVGSRERIEQVKVGASAVIVGRGESELGSG